MSEPVPGSTEQVDELRTRLRNAEVRLEESTSREEQRRVETLEIKNLLDQATAQVSELKRVNNSSEGERDDLDTEVGELKTFVALVARDVGLDPSSKEITLALVRDQVKRKTKQSCHEEIGGGLVTKVRKILDPSNQYESVVDAAKAVMTLKPATPHSPGAIIAGDLARVKEELMNERTLRENAEHQNKIVREELVGKVREAIEEQYETLVSGLREDNERLSGDLTALRGDWGKILEATSTAHNLAQALFYARHDPSSYEDLIPENVR